MGWEKLIQDKFNITTAGTRKRAEKKKVVRSF